MNKIQKLKSYQLSCEALQITESMQVKEVESFINGSLQFSVQEKKLVLSVNNKLLFCYYNDWILKYSDTVTVVTNEFKEIMFIKELEN